MVAVFADLRPESCIFPHSVSQPSRLHLTGSLQAFPAAWAPWRGWLTETEAKVLVALLLCYRMGPSVTVCFSRYLYHCGLLGVLGACRPVLHCSNNYVKIMWRKMDSLFYLAPGFWTPATSVVSVTVIVDAYGAML